MEKTMAFQTAKNNVDIVQTIAGGKIPTNAQLEAVLTTTAQVLERDGSSLPPEGQKATKDAVTVLNDVQLFLHKKNQDDSIQGIISDFSTLSVGVELENSTGNTASIKDAAVTTITHSGTELRYQKTPKFGLNELIAHTKKLTKAVVRSSQLREAFRELFETLRWGYFERSRTNNWKEEVGCEGKCEGREESRGTDSGTNAKIQSYSLMTPEYRPIERTLASSYLSISSNHAPLHRVKEDSTHHIEEEAETLEKLQSFRPMTKAEGAEFRNRIFSILIKFSWNTEFKTSLLNVFALFMFYKNCGWSSLKELASKLKSSKAPQVEKQTTPHPNGTDICIGYPVSGTPVFTAPTLSPEKQTRKVMKKLKKFVETFMPGKSLDNFLRYTRECIHLIWKDEDLSNYLDEVGTFLKSTMNSNYESVEMIEQSRVEQLEELIHRGDSLFMSFTNHFVVYRMVCETIEVLRAVQSDPLTKKLAEDTRIFVNDFLAYDAEGKPRLNSEVVSQMKQLLLPLLKEQLFYIPIPKIEGTNSKMDFWVENLVFSTEDVLPDNLRFELHHTLTMNRKSESVSDNVTRICLTLENMKTRLKDVRFWYRKKTSPKITDQGFADIYLHGRGARVKLVIRANLSSPQPFITECVKVRCDKLRIKVHESKHDFIYAFAIALFKKKIKRVLQLRAESSLRSIFDKMNSQLNKLVITSQHPACPCADLSLLPN